MHSKKRKKIPHNAETRVADPKPVGSVVFLGLLDPDPLVRGTDPDASIIKQKYQEKP